MKPAHHGQHHVSRGHSVSHALSPAYLPVFGALLGDSYGVIQPDDTAGFLQILHAALESRRGDVKPGGGTQKGDLSGWPPRKGWLPGASQCMESLWVRCKQQVI